MMVAIHCFIRGKTRILAASWLIVVASLCVQSGCCHCAIPPVAVQDRVDSLNKLHKESVIAYYSSIGDQSLLPSGEVVSLMEHLKYEIHELGYHAIWNCKAATFVARRGPDPDVIKSIEFMHRLLDRVD